MEAVAGNYCMSQPVSCAFPTVIAWRLAVKTAMAVAEEGLAYRKVPSILMRHCYHTAVNCSCWPLWSLR